MKFLENQIGLIATFGLLSIIVFMIITVESHATYRKRHQCVNIGSAELSYRPLRINGSNVEYTASETYLYECDNGLRRM